MRKKKATGFERSLEDFFDVERKETFWCMFCKDYFSVEDEEEHPTGVLCKLTCGHVGLKWNLRNLTRYHKEKMKFDDAEVS